MFADFFLTIANGVDRRHMVRGVDLKISVSLDSRRVLQPLLEHNNSYTWVSLLVNEAHHHNSQRRKKERKKEMLGGTLEREMVEIQLLIVCSRTLTATTTVVCSSRHQIG